MWIGEVWRILGSGVWCEGQMDCAYGTFLEHLSPEELEQKLSLIDINENTKEILPYVINSAIRFYKNPEAYYRSKQIYDAEYYDADGFDEIDNENRKLLLA